MIMMHEGPRLQAQIAVACDVELHRAIAALGVRLHYYWYVYV